jgi:acyl-CoA hydrolase
MSVTEINAKIVYARLITELTEAVLEPLNIRYCDLSPLVRDKIEVNLEEALGDETPEQLEERISAKIEDEHKVYVETLLTECIERLRAEDLIDADKVADVVTALTAVAKDQFYNVNLKVN